MKVVWEKATEDPLRCGEGSWMIHTELTHHELGLCDGILARRYEDPRTRKKCELFNTLGKIIIVGIYISNLFTLSTFT